MKIVIWTGGAFETWGPNSVDEGGIGGSETAAIRIAEKLAIRGHHVEIWGRVVDATVMPPCQGRSGRILYRGGDGMPVGEECDVFVSSREISSLSEIKPKCRLSVLWMHDAHAGEDWQNLMSGYDLVFCLSGWALEHLAGRYSRVPVEKFVLTRNGIEPSLFVRPGEYEDIAQPVVKDGARFIYSSSPDRGLGRLLDLWPAIKDKIPEATLDVYYGFDNLRAWHDQNPKPGNVDRMLQVDYLEHRLQEMQSQGVQAHGRVGQPELARAFMSSLAWLYPTSFCETFCITALEAQAASCRPFTSRLGALPETVSCGTLVDDPHEPVYDRTFVRKLVDFVQDRNGERTAACVFAWAARRRILVECTWKSVAREWEDLFRRRMRT